MFGKEWVKKQLVVSVKIKLQKNGEKLFLLYSAFLCNLQLNHITFQTLRC